MADKALLQHDQHDMAAHPPVRCFVSSSHGNNGAGGDGDATEQSMRITTIFVVRFDTTHGNVVEWQWPRTAAAAANEAKDQGQGGGQAGDGLLQLDRIEFKAMASGLHAVMEDFVMFTHNGLYGIAAFNQLKTADAVRGARLRSVGVLCASHLALRHYYPDLARFAAMVNQNPQPEDLSSTGQQRYPFLVEYYQQRDSHLPSPQSPGKPLPADDTMGFLADYIGSDLLLIWKALLLRLRVLFYSPVPIGPACARVDSCFAMISNEDSTQPHSSLLRMPHRLYYINLDDFDAVSKSPFYVACTTEKIFQLKPEVWDVFVDNQNVILHDRCTALLRRTPKQREVFAQIQNKIASRHRGPVSSVEKDRSVIACFAQLNHQLFDALYAATSAGNGLRKEDLLRMNLDPSESQMVDRLAELYGFSCRVAGGGGAAAACLCCR